MGGTIPFDVCPSSRDSPLPCPIQAFCRGPRRFSSAFSGVCSGHVCGTRLSVLFRRIPGGPVRHGREAVSIAAKMGLGRHHPGFGHHLRSDGPAFEPPQKEPASNGLNSGYTTLKLACDVIRVRIRREPDGRPNAHGYLTRPRQNAVGPLDFEKAIYTHRHNGNI